jgi:hypothetical protein
MVWWRESCREAGDGDASTRRLHEWISSLPWVVERTPTFGPDGLRTFAVDCEPLGLRRLWLVTGLSPRRGVAVIVPVALADDLELVGLARSISPMPAGYELVEAVAGVTCDELERIVIEAYESAMS